MKHASLFSGIGGFDLAAEWVGWENVFHCEINPWCQKVLKYHFPNSKQYDDITKTDFSCWRGAIDILTGGFPCQPFSVAGSRKGKDDDRYLWPEMLRAIREIQPGWVVGENVAGLLSMVQPGSEVTVESQASLFEEVNKETILEQEYVVETVCRDLEEEGYSVQPIVIPACAVGAPHRRDRIWFVANRSDARTKNLQERKDSICKSESPAYAYGVGCGNRSDNRQERPIYNNKKRYALEDQSERAERECRFSKDSTTIANSNDKRLQSRIQSGRYDSERRETANGYAPEYSLNGRGTPFSTFWDNFPTQSPVCSRDDGLSSRLDGISFCRWREESIKAYGNAIVPQVAFEIFKAIQTINQ
nr:DNA (cytosine-5-)-methyltransferase [Parabacteroides goldsteinii]